MPGARFVEPVRSPLGDSEARGWVELTGPQSFNDPNGRAAATLAAMMQRLAGDGDGFAIESGGLRASPDSSVESFTEPTDGPDIIVIASRPEYGGSGTGSGNFDPQDPDASVPDPGEETGQEEPTPDCAETTAQIGFGVALDEEERGELDTIGAAAEDLAERIGALPSNGVFSSSGGAQISAGELYELLVLADLIVTNEAFYDGTSDFDSAGSAQRNNGNPNFFLNESNGLDWGASIEHAAFYLLHELAHVSKAGYSLSKATTQAGYRRCPTCAGAVGELDGSRDIRHFI